MTGPRTEEEWRWAEALAFLKLWGGDAPLRLTERIGVVALLGDDEGVKRLKAIAACLDVLIRMPARAS